MPESMKPKNPRRHANGQRNASLSSPVGGKTSSATPTPAAAPTTCPIPIRRKTRHGFMLLVLCTGAPYIVDAEPGAARSVAGSRACVILRSIGCCVEQDTSIQHLRCAARALAPRCHQFALNAVDRGATDRPGLIGPPHAIARGEYQSHNVGVTPSRCDVHGLLPLVAGVYVQANACGAQLRAVRPDSLPWPSSASGLLALGVTARQAQLLARTPS